MIKSDAHIFGGMQRDRSVSKQSPEFLWDALNIRMTARDGDTMLSITNEKGTSIVEDSSLDTPRDIEFKGTYLGHCVINNYLIVFTTDNSKDYIYRVDKSYNYHTDLLWDGDSKGSLGFSKDYPIECLGVYENSEIQKVYWVDGKNQPRVINIMKDPSKFDSKTFDFVQELALTEKISVSKESNSSGVFPAGVIQYAMTYYSKYGQESNIAYITPLFYTSYNDRAGSPEDRIGNAFRLTISGADRRFDYVRLYSIMRTSINSVPTVKRLTDIELVPSNVVGTNVSRTWYNMTSAYYYCYVKTSSDSEYRNIQNYSYEYYETTGGAGAKGNYYVFKRKDYPELIIKHISEGKTKYYTWSTESEEDGGTSEIWVSRDQVGGAGSIGYKIFCKGGSNTKGMMQVMDSVISEYAITYLDKGDTGEAIDPTTLLYIGGENIKASAIAQKDGTLFMGNYEIIRDSIDQSIKDSFKMADTDNFTEGARTVYLSSSNSSSRYDYMSTLNGRSANTGGETVNPSYFKKGERYRFGMQFQYKNGKWSEPIFLKDYTINSFPFYDGSHLFLRTLKKEFNLQEIYNLGYRRVRGLVVFPTLQDRKVLAQGVLCPTVFNIQDRENHTPDAQSSWFFRLTPASFSSNETSIGQGANIQYKHNMILYGDTDRGAEIQGIPSELSSYYVDDKGTYDRSVTSIIDPVKVRIGQDINNVSNYIEVRKEQMNNIFAVDRSILTMHSPDFEFEDGFSTLDFNNLQLQIVGKVGFSSCMGDIDIQTSSPTIAPNGAGFLHKSFISSGTDASRGMVSGLFYSDYTVDDIDNGQGYQAYDRQHYDFLFMVYPWQKSGSINNDIVRPNNAGTRSAVLSKKKISNLRFSKTVKWSTDASITLPSITNQVTNIQFFNSDQVALTKLGDLLYYGNVDTMISPCVEYGTVFNVGNNASGAYDSIRGEYDNNIARKASFTGLYFWKMSKWGAYRCNKGYSPKWDCRETDLGDDNGNLRTSKEAIRMKYKSTPHLVCKLSNSLDQTMDASGPYLYMAELVRNIDDSTMFGGNTDEALRSNLWVPAGDIITINPTGNTTVEFKYGDTWYQRYDCLKTYPFTMEDENSIVDIASFFVETRVNIDGRYDRNRGQLSNLMMSPTNFNKINPVYSQMDNFFSYRILDTDYYKLNSFPNSITWSKEKQPASIVDTWTNITLANVLDLDGDKGNITALKVWNDNLYCFQTKGISNILFNSRVQIPTSDGVPVEITNNYKVDGKRYITDAIGCSNKWSISNTPSGLYFIDHIGNVLYNLGGNGLASVSGSHGFDSWFDTQDTHTPWNPSSFAGIKTYYDFNHHDLYVTTQNDCLAFSELLGQFTSFMSYEGTPAMFNIGSDFYSIKDGKLWRMFSGNYNDFFNNYKPHYITFISNSDSTLDKIFNTLEARVDFWQNTTLQHRRFYDYIRVWNEYQDTGFVPLDFKNCKPSITKKKFRVWRVNIPRDKTRKLDRIRNTWSYVSLGMFSNAGYSNSMRMELHDLSVQYFI